MERSPRKPEVVIDCRGGVLAPGDIVQLHVAAFDQAAAAAAQVHPIDAAETEEVVFEDKDFAVHDASCRAGSLSESWRSWSPWDVATVESKTAGWEDLFRVRGGL